ncbi:glycosyltransferase family 4 protein [Limnoraphis robusta]|uniref:Glycosyltransferase family 4 protein n=1 Tax=Limnoraphis robusta CCNP1315 TaxID=3110306 RepID=A0ABU5TW72_9CYAN|nr:glycosyltransferase family 4 protein [Limnoraphis robusta]MEA5519144.1 glycosyltransferase family 4 protein [Limnoraphis robusta CCNP1315]MEA5548127.1 glycosyltransferase family 4 protein [Limnoraphis robusta CCNP1324]
MKNILLSAYACQPNKGSELGFGWNWAWYLAQLGHEVWVLTRSHAESKAAWEEVLATQPLPNLHFFPVDIPNRLKPYLKGKIGVYLHYLIWQRQAYTVALKLNEKHNFDLIHHVTWGSLTAGSELWRLNKPFVFGPVGGGQIAPPAFKSYFLDQWRSEAFRSFANTQLLPLNLIARQTVSHADLILATNQDTAHLAKRLGASWVELFLDTGLEENYFPDSPPNRSQTQPFKLLWVGRLFHRKGLLLALEALAKVNSEIPIQLTIVGGGSLDQYIPQWLKDLQLESKVEVKGQISWTEVKQEYLTNDVFLFTSLRDSFGSQLVEAMAYALPVIVLNHQGAGDLVPDTAGIKVSVTQPSETVAELALAIELMYKHPQKRWEMGQQGYEFARQQIWSKKAISIDHYYERLMNSKKH